MSEKQTSYSQCPGEVYDSFWQNDTGINEPTFNADTLVKGLCWDGNRFNKTSKQYRVDYFRKEDLERRWKFSDSLHGAISEAYRMIQSGNTIEAITLAQVST